MTSVNELNAYNRGRRELVEEIQAVLRETPDVNAEIYINTVRHGNKDDMFDLGVKVTKDAIEKICTFGQMQKQ